MRETIIHEAFAAVVLTAFVTFVATQIVIVRLREHRTDLRPEQHFGEGRSWAWQLNVMNRANYDAAGRKRVRTLYLLQALLMLCFVLGVVFAVVESEVRRLVAVALIAGPVRLLTRASDDQRKLGFGGSRMSIR
jgi:hypothetical protein